MPNDLLFPNGTFQFIVDADPPQATNLLVAECGQLMFQTTNGQYQMQIVVGVNASAWQTVTYSPNTITVSAPFQVLVGGARVTYAMGSAVSVVKAPSAGGQPVVVVYGTVVVTTSVSNKTYQASFLAIQSIQPAVGHYDVTTVTDPPIDVATIQIVATGAVTVTPESAYGLLVSSSWAAPILTWTTQTSTLIYTFTGIVDVDYNAGPPAGLTWSFGGSWLSKSSEPFGGDADDAGNWMSSSGVSTD
jgi:hypothetical protein